MASPIGAARVICEAMPSPAESNDNLRPPPRWLRWVRWFTWKRVRRFLIVSTVLLAAGYWIENVRGRRAFQKCLDRYAEAGISLDPQDYLAAEPPPEENFGATPLLDGIAADDWLNQPGVSREIRKRRRLSFPNYQTNERSSISGVTYYRGDQNPRRKLPDGSWTSQRPPDAPVPATRAIDWYVCSVAMERMNGTASATSPVQTVYATLDSERDVFDELVDNSLRKSAVFTPAPALRSKRRMQDRRPWLDSLCSLLRLRSSAAATLKNPNEAASLTRVIWRIREALMAEPGGIFRSIEAANLWIACAEDVVRSGAATDAVLTELLNHPEQHWNAEEEWLHALCASSAAGAAFWEETAKEASWSITGDLQGAFKYRYFDLTREALWMPKGWLLQNGAEDLRSFIEFRLLPLRDGGLAALPAATAAWDAEWSGEGRSWWWSAHPYTYFLRFFAGGKDTTLLLPTHAICRIRLTILALGMERYRLAHGRYPADPAALVPQFLPALPPDMDRAPLRCVTRPDGSGAVLYSIGWNLTDDWHGVIPDGKGEPHYSEADWALTLPLPPLNPP
jgi:hypothetical protein